MLSESIHPTNQIPYEKHCSLWEWCYCRIPGITTLLYFVACVVFFSNLAAPGLTLGYWRGGILTHPKLNTKQFLIWPEVCQQECDWFLKKPENIVTNVRRPYSGGFSSLERWKQQFRVKITKTFYCKEDVIRSSNYLKLMAINRPVQSLLLKINKWNLILIYCSSCFSFTFLLPNYGFRNTFSSPSPAD